MKKMFSIVGLALMAGGLFAVDFDIKSIRQNYSEKKYDAVITACEQSLAAVKQAEDQKAKRELAYFLTIAKFRKGAYKTSAEAIDAMKATFADLGFTGDYLFGEIFILQLFGDHSKVVPLAQASSIPSVRLRGALSLFALKRYGEAAEMAFSTGLPIGYPKAVYYARVGGLSEKVYEYAMSGIQKGHIKHPADVKRLVNYILATDFTGTSITDAKVKALLQTVNRRYSRFLKPGVTTAWDEVIQTVRQTLETY